MVRRTSRLGSDSAIPGLARRSGLARILFAVAAAYAAAWAVGIAFALALQRTPSWRTGAAWERAVLTWLHGHPQPYVIDRLLLASPYLATNYTVLPLTLLGGAVLWRCHGRARVALHLLVVSLGSASLNPSMKYLLGRPRPTLFPQRGMFQWASYPSGHAILSTAFYFTVALLLWRTRGTRWMFLVAAAVVVISAYARLYLAVHWPTDVIGGLLIGATWLAGSWWALGAWSVDRNRL